MILFAPSWFAMQELLDVLEHKYTTYSILCNTTKTVCMVFNPRCSNKIVSTNFPSFTINGHELKFVTHFEYLRHMINNKLSDSGDIERETKDLFIRCNMLLNRFSLCSTGVKCVLFKTYCLFL